MGVAAVLGGSVKISGGVDDELNAIGEFSVGTVAQAAKIVEYAVLPCSRGDFEYNATVVGPAERRSPIKTACGIHGEITIGARAVCAILLGTEGIERLFGIRERTVPGPESKNPNGKYCCRQHAETC
jgi:hypothetical protein